MDWPRAKTILIVALLLLNAFLYHQIYGGAALPAPEASYLTAFPEEPLLAELEAYGVQAEFPDGAPSRLPPLRLVPRPTAFDPETAFAGQAFETSQGTMGPCTGTLYTTDTHMICVSEDGWLFYALTQRADRERATPADLDAAGEQVAALFDVFGGVPSDLQGPEITFNRQGATYVFRYEQVIEDAAGETLWIFPGAVEVHATGLQVVSYRRRLWDVHPAGSPPEPVMPITNLLRRQLADHDRVFDLLERHALGPTGDLEMRFRLGYALGPVLEAEAGDLGDSPGLAFEGRPAWQVLLGGAPPLLFDARSGEPIEAFVP